MQNVVCLYISHYLLYESKGISFPPSQTIPSASNHASHATIPLTPYMSILRQLLPPLPPFRLRIKPNQALSARLISLPQQLRHIDVQRRVRLRRRQQLMYRRERRGNGIRGRPGRLQQVEADLAGLDRVLDQLLRSTRCRGKLGKFGRLRREERRDEYRRRRTLKWTFGWQMGVTNLTSGGERG